jgi:hypothetical protein
MAVRHMHTLETKLAIRESILQQKQLKYVK